ncbi:four helix bundle protein, partial [Rhizobium leguminosarum]|uniref:four helix bundle protein n=1 Tax=Rhizobium leguminosarum TaxID=384 RepID=UPI003F9976B3
NQPPASVAANIAEEPGRENRGSFAQFLQIAQGSLKELETHLIIAGRIGFLQAAALAELLDLCDEIGQMLGSLIRRVQHR